MFEEFSASGSRKSIPASSQVLHQKDEPLKDGSKNQAFTEVQLEKLGSASSVRIPFFRWFGPTGIAPGYKKILVDIRQPLGPAPKLKSDSRSSGGGTSQPVAPSQKPPIDTPLFEADNITPSSDVLYPLLETFFDYYSCHFLFYDRRSFIERVRSGNVSALLLNSICGLAARFSNLPCLQNAALYLRGDVFAEKAKLLLVPLLILPSYEVVASILIIVWLELASNHDVGVWMYTGMACRMAVDLGMHKAHLPSPHNGSVHANDTDRLRYLDHTTSLIRTSIGLCPIYSGQSIFWTTSSVSQQGDHPLSNANILTCLIRLHFRLGIRQMKRYPIPLLEPSW